MELSCPQMVAESQEGKGVSYDVVAVLRLQDKTHRRSFMRTWVRAMRANKQDP